MSSAASESPEGDQTTQRGTADIFADITGDVVIVNPTPTMIQDLAIGQGGLDDLGDVRIISDEVALKEVRDDFVHSAQIVERIDAGDLDVRVNDDATPSTPILVTEDRVVALIETPTAPITMESDDSDAASAAFDSYGDLWEQGEEFNFRTPALDRFRSSFRESFGEEAEQDLYEILTILSEDEKYDSTKMNESVAALIVAGKHELLLYDVGRWGEDNDVASKATFSRSKTRLEDRGVLETGKVPVDVGRPRLRLGLTGDAVSNLTGKPAINVTDDDISDLTPENLAELVKENS